MSTTWPWSSTPTRRSIRRPICTAPGGTARAGNSGSVITLATPDQAQEVRQLTRAAGITPTTTKINSTDHAVLSELAPGPRVRAEITTPVVQTAGDLQSRNGNGRSGAPRSANAGVPVAAAEVAGADAARAVVVAGQAGDVRRARARDQGRHPAGLRLPWPRTLLVLLEPDHDRDRQRLPQRRGLQREASVIFLPRRRLPRTSELASPW